ncbi:hypothetical protein [Streptomyces sp. NPDC050704]|uniref:hypothetical protein n=1 Tax=Streptomyces sp. NPDC050704 TaxID=3157219 RepID=UPI0034404A8A
MGMQDQFKDKANELKDKAQKRGGQGQDDMSERGSQQPPRREHEREREQGGQREPGRPGQPGQPGQREQGQKGQRRPEESERGRQTPDETERSAQEQQDRFDQDYDV